MIAGILLAAGESKRFRSENKLLYEISPGTTIIECSLKTFINSQVDKIIVVVGFQHKYITQKIQPIIDSSKIPLEIIFNPHFQAGGMSSSIIKGIELAMGAEAVIITPADIPFIPSEVIDTLIDYFNLNKPEIIIPTYNDRKGHPIVIRSTLFPNLLAITEKYRGLKEITKRFHDKIVYLKTNVEGITRDFDTRLDLLKFK